jgi:hypothetical protein
VAGSGIVSCRWLVPGLALYALWGHSAGVLGGHLNKGALCVSLGPRRNDRDTKGANDLFTEPGRDDRLD